MELTPVLHWQYRHNFTFFGGESENSFFQDSPTLYNTYITCITPDYMLFYMLLRCVSFICNIQYIDVCSLLCENLTAKQKLTDIEWLHLRQNQSFIRENNCRDMYFAMIK